MANGASKARWSKNTEELTRQDVSELVPRVHAMIKRPNVQRTLARLGHGVALAVGGPVIVRCVMSIQPMMGRTERKGKKIFSTQLRTTGPGTDYKWGIPDLRSAFS
jgi:hypothetical protein